MPAIPHVIRRGAIYYWRRRLPAPLAESRKSATLLLGLRTSDSRRARFLAGQVTALVDLHFFPAVMNQRLNQKQIQTIFRDVFTRHLDRLEGVAARERMEPGFDAEDSRRSDRVMGWAYRLLETRGGAAASTRAAGRRCSPTAWSEAAVAEVAAMLAMMRRQNFAAERPERLKTAIENAGAEPNPLNLALAQEAIHRAMAEANFPTARRYDGARVETAPLIADILTRRAIALSGAAASDAARNAAGFEMGLNNQGAPSLPMRFGQAPQERGVPTLEERPTSGRLHEADSAPLGAAADPPAQIRSAPQAKAKPLSLEMHPVVVFGEKLIAQNRDDWDTKAQRQARQIFRLFGKLLLEQEFVEPAALAAKPFRPARRPSGGGRHQLRQKPKERRAPRRS